MCSNIVVVCQFHVGNQCPQSDPLSEDVCIRWTKILYFICNCSCQSVHFQNYLPLWEKNKTKTRLCAILYDLISLGWNCHVFYVWASGIVTEQKTSRDPAALFEHNEKAAPVSKILLCCPHQGILQFGFKCSWKLPVVLSINNISDGTNWATLLLLVLLRIGCFQLLIERISIAEDVSVIMRSTNVALLLSAQSVPVVTSVERDCKWTGVCSAIMFRSHVHRSLHDWLLLLSTRLWGPFNIACVTIDCILRQLSRWHHPCNQLHSHRHHGRSYCGPFF